jgi:hypothetical protein
MRNRLTHEERITFEAELETLQEEHRDLDAAHHRAIAVKHHCYHERLARRSTLARDRAIVLIGLFILALLACYGSGLVQQWWEAFRP